MTSIEPATITPTTANVTVRGENLRPFLRVSFGQHQGVTFALSTPTTAEVKVPELPAGKYDLILYDVAREVSRLPNAVTVEAAPLPSAQASMLVAGSFVALDTASAAEIVKGAEMTAMGGNVVKVLDVGAAGGDTRWVQVEDVQVEVPLQASRQQPALLQARCTIADRRCQVGGIDIERLHALSLFTKGGRPASVRRRRSPCRWPDGERDRCGCASSRRLMPHRRFALAIATRAARFSGTGWRRSARLAPARRTSGDLMLARRCAGWRRGRLVAHGAPMAAPPSMRP